MTTDPVGDLVREWWWLAYAVSRNLHKDLAFVPFEDVYSAAAEGLWRAAQTRDKVVKSFEQHARRQMVWRVFDHVRSVSHWDHNGGRHASAVVPRSRIVPLTAIGDDEWEHEYEADGVEGAETIMDLAGFWEGLTRQEKRIFDRLLMGMRGIDIAHEFGVTESDVSFYRRTLRNKWRAFQGVAA